jgi:Pyruvate formate lyase-like
LPDEIHWHDYINWNVLASPGHLSPDYEDLLARGLGGIAERAEGTARRQGTERAQLFAQNARDCTESVRRLALRYATAARAAGNPQAAAALVRVPFESARSFFEAVQSCWFAHMVLSCCIGGRDYGFGRMDQYLFPFYETDIALGRLTRQDAVDILADLCLKTNAIAGTGCAHYHTRPVPCQSSKQYVILGGVSADGRDMSNEVSFAFLEAAREVKLTEPVLHVRVHPGVTSPFKAEAVRATIELQGQVQFSNDRLIPASLVRKGIRPKDAHDYTATGCSRIDAGPNHSCNEHYLSPVFWLIDALGWDESAGLFAPPLHGGFEDLMAAFRDACETGIGRQAAQWLAQAEPVYERAFTNAGGEHFHFESLLLRDCVERGLNTCHHSPLHIVPRWRFS